MELSGSRKCSYSASAESASLLKTKTTPAMFSVSASFPTFFRSSSNNPTLFAARRLVCPMRVCCIVRFRIPNSQRGPAPRKSTPLSPLTCVTFHSWAESSLLSDSTTNTSNNWNLFRRFSGGIDVTSWNLLPSQTDFITSQNCARSSFMANIFTQRSGHWSTHSALNTPTSDER